MLKFEHVVWFFSVLFYASVAICDSGNLAKLPNPRLISFSDFQYKGAFRLPVAQFGDSNVSYAEGHIAYNSSNHSLFIVGHSHQQAIAEFSIPELRVSSNIDELNIAPAPIQNFNQVLGRAPFRVEGQIIDTIGGILHYNGKLIVNAFEYYDAPADNTLTTLVINNSDKLSSSSVGGFFSLQGRVHAAGWMSPIPPAWQQALGGKWIAGNSSYMPIISRLSVGPTAFVFDPDDFGKKEPVPSIALLDFSLENPLHDDLMNETDHRLWNHMSRAVFGFIAPGTSTYVTLGFSGGHQSGVCYKCIPAGSSTECYGYCAKDITDYHLMYWLWDVNELAKVHQGRLQPHQILPYEYGKIDPPFPTTQLGGGSFDAESGQLYLTLQSADTKQTAYGPPPIVAVYQLK